MTPIWENNNITSSFPFHFIFSFLLIFFLLLFLFWDRVTSIPNWSWTYYVAEVNLELLYLLPRPLERWDYRHARPYLVYIVLGIEPRASCMLSQYSTNWAIQLQKHNLKERPEFPNTNQACYIPPAFIVPEEGIEFSESEVTDGCVMSSGHWTRTWALWKRNRCF